MQLRGIAKPKHYGN